MDIDRLEPDSSREHHRAFDVPAPVFDATTPWTEARAEVITRGGETVSAGPAGWNSRPVYLWGPDSAVLELIARADLIGADDRTDPGPDSECLLRVSEVVVPVDDAVVAARRLHRSTGLPFFVPVRDDVVPPATSAGC